MDTRNDILNELKALGSTLAEREVTNVFTVPDGYFEGLGDSVMRAINGDTILKNINQPDSAGVPAGYFEGLAGSIMDKIKAQQAATNPVDEAISPLLESLRHKNVFEVPAGYFEGLTASITERIDTADELVQLPAVLKDLQQKNVFEVPQGYFEALTGNISARIDTADELVQLPAVLKDLQQKNVFEVPQGYFEGLAPEIMSKLKPAPAKLVKMSSLRLARYAVAAAFIGAMALGVYKFIPPDGSELTLTNVQKDGIAMSTDEGKYNSTFEQVSDDAIVKFLETGGHDVDAALAAVAVDEKELPSEDDLMLDDKALDDFLNNITDKNLNN